MSYFLKAKIDIDFLNGEKTTIPCFKVLAPFIMDKMQRQQGEDIKAIKLSTITDEEYQSLLKLEDHPILHERITNEEIFHQHFWNST